MEYHPIPATIGARSAPRKKYGVFPEEHQKIQNIRHAKRAENVCWGRKHEQSRKIGARSAPRKIFWAYFTRKTQKKQESGACARNTTRFWGLLGGQIFFYSSWGVTPEYLEYLPLGNNKKYSRLFFLFWPGPALGIPPDFQQAKGADLFLLRPERADGIPADSGSCWGGRFSRILAQCQNSYSLTTRRKK